MQYITGSLISYKEEDKFLFIQGSLIYVPFTPINNEVNYILVMPLSKTKQDTSTLSSLCDFIYQTFFNKTAKNGHHQPLNLPWNHIRMISPGGVDQGLQLFYYKVF